MKRYTVEFEWLDGGVEEIDVDAENRIEAMREASRIVDERYMPGARLVKCTERIGLYF